MVTRPGRGGPAVSSRRRPASVLSHLVPSVLCKDDLSFLVKTGTAEVEAKLWHEPALLDDQ
jgi:hypothetical protein